MTDTETQAASDDSPRRSKGSSVAASSHSLQVQALARRVGYAFADESILVEALTHSSAAAESAVANNQRLEFLGDAVLDLAISDLLMKRLPTEREGVLTRIRASLVSAASLAEIAREIDLGAAVRMGRGEIRSGGRDKQGILADALEAVLAAVFLDGGYAAVEPVVAALFESRLARTHGLTQDYKTKLQELAQLHRKLTPTYRTLGVDGPDHEPEFRVEVLLDEEVVGAGRGPSRKEAEQRAALEAIGGFADIESDEEDQEIE